MAVPRRARAAGGRRLVLLVLGPLVVVAALFVVLVPPRMNALVDDAAERRTQGVAEVLADLVAPAVEFDDVEEAERALALLASQRDARAGVVLDAAGRAFARWPKDAMPLANSRDDLARLRDAGYGLIVEVPVVAAGGARGTLALAFSTDALDRDKRTNWLVGLAVSAVLVVIGGVFAAFAARSVARRAAAEAALAQEELKFRTLVEGLPDALLIHRGGKLVYANAAVEALVGLEVVDPRGAIVPALDALLDTDASASQLELIRADGARAQFELHASLLVLDDEAALIVLARDVTDRRRLHERVALSDRLASLGTLAAGVGHEINNPLTFILSNLEFLGSELAAARDPATGAVALPGAAVAEIQVALDDAQIGAQRVQHIVQDMKKLARGDAGSREPVDVVATVAGAVKMVATQVRRRAQLDLALAPVPAVLGGESQLMQVLLNLVTNAAEATPDGARASDHRITVATQVSTTGQVEISVTDTGAGIPPEAQAKIFDAFYTTKPVGIGTGLGLSISHNIVTAMGGTLGFTTTLGRGTTFTVSLPPAPATVPGRRARTARSTDRIKILVVDDEQAVAAATARLLPGHDVAIETSSERALARLRDGESFDLILCDVRMPGLTGPELRSRLTATRPELGAALVFMTGAAEGSAAAGLADVPILAKPFDRATLGRFIDAQLGRLRGVA